jgi:hypothetical protein
LLKDVAIVPKKKLDQSSGLIIHPAILNKHKHGTSFQMADGEIVDHLHLIMKTGSYLTVKNSNYVTSLKKERVGVKLAEMFRIFVTFSKAF